MARFTYRSCKCCRELHELSAWPDACMAHFGPEASGGPQIISDTIEPFRNMATGEMFSSKSRYRADLKARGLVEVGNERIVQRPAAAPPIREAMRQALHQLR